MITFANNLIQHVGGATLVRAPQVGFPVELTGTWESAGTGTGYPWKRLTVSRAVGSSPTSPTLASPTAQGALQETGQYAAALDGSTQFTAGMRGWLEIAAESTAYWFLPFAVTGPGADRIYVTDTEINDSPATQIYQYQSDERGPTAPVFYQQRYRDANGYPAFYQAEFPQGTGVAQGVAPTNAPMVYQQSNTSSTTGTPLSVVYGYTIGGVTSTQTYTQSGANIVNTGVNATLAGSLAGGGPTVPTWTKYAKTYTDFSDAGTTRTITIATLTARQRVRGIVMRHSASFTGGGAGVANIGLGRTGNNTQYIAAQDVLGAPSNTSFGNVDGFSTYYDHTGWTINATLTCDVALNTLTAGAVDIWLETWTLPA